MNICRCPLAGHGVDTPANHNDRVTTVLREGGSRCPGTLTSRYGSDLLPLRLPWHCSWVDRFFHPPQSGGFANFATFARSARSPAAFALRLCSWSLMAGWSRPACAPVLARSSNLDPSGPLRQSDGSKLPEGPDSTRARFLSISRLVAQFHIRNSWRVRPRPEELVKAAYLLLREAGDQWTSSTVRSPVARAYLTAGSAAFFITAGTSLFFQRTKRINTRSSVFARISSSQDTDR